MNIDLNMAGNMLGPLSGDLRARLMAAIENPGEETWDDAHSIELSSRGVTLWQAVCAVDPLFPTTGPRYQWIDDDSELGGHSEQSAGWERTPDAETICQAINFATR